MDYGPPFGTLCANCRRRLATLRWMDHGSALDLVHGGGAFWCEVCATEAQLAYARERAAAIPELEAKLVELLSDDSL